MREGWLTVMSRTWPSWQLIQIMYLELFRYESSSFDMNMGRGPEVLLDVNLADVRSYCTSYI